MSPFLYNQVGLLTSKSLKRPMPADASRPAPAPLYTSAETALPLPPLPLPHIIFPSTNPLPHPSPYTTLHHTSLASNSNSNIYCTKLDHTLLVVGHFPPSSSPSVEDDLAEDDGVLHQGEEDQQHAGQQPHLQGRHSVGDRDTRPAVRGHVSAVSVGRTKLQSLFKICQNYCI